MSAAPKVPRRDAPVACASCGREVARRARQQRFCSARCRKRGHYAQSVRKGVFSISLLSDTALGTNPPKKDNKFKALQRAKMLSSHRILGPPHVLAVEVFARAWKGVTSSGGVAIEIGRLRARALVESVGAES